MLFRVDRLLVCHNAGLTGKELPTKDECSKPEP